MKILPIIDADDERKERILERDELERQYEEERFERWCERRVDA